MTAKSHNHLKAFVVASVLGLGALLHATPLFRDTFERPDSEDLNESTDGKSGIFGPLNWVQLGGGNFDGGMEVVDNQLIAGDNRATNGWAMSYIDHNFVDPAIAEAGGFSISIDILEYATAGARRHVAFMVGMSEEDAAGSDQNNPANMDYVDLFVGYLGTNNEVEAFESGTKVFGNTDAGGPGTLPKTLKVDFSFTSFDAGSPVEYVVTFEVMRKWDPDHSNGAGPTKTTSACSAI